MKPAHSIEREIGIDWYVSDAPGVGGRLRHRPADFRVKELEDFETVPVDADPAAYPHVVFRATLTEWDTNDFAKALSDRLGISRERVSWAGTKDKHGITTQLFSVDGIDPTDLPELPETRLEVVGRAGRGIYFGDLVGNSFTITIREPDRPELVDIIRDQLVAFGGGNATVGVPNYFGHQRFGSRRPITHTVGLAICKGEWHAAVEAYLGGPHPDEPPDTRAARERFDSGDDLQEVLDVFPPYLRYERAMLQRLVEADRRTAEAAESTDDDRYRSALDALPRNLQRLFVNAAQSWLFNRIVSERIAAGIPLDRAVEGDVVCFVDTGASAPIPIPDPDRIQRVPTDRVEAINRHCDRGRAFVTAPIVGTDTTFGTGEPGEIEHAVLESAGLTRADFDRPDPFGATGTRRPILLRTDLEIERDPLTFSFPLPRGSYATVLLREFLKTHPKYL